MKEVELYRSKPFGFRAPFAGSPLWNLLSDEFDVFLNTTGAEKNDVSFAPRTNIEETKDAFVVSFDLPGVRKEDVKIDVQSRTITVSGERRRESESSSGGFKRYECVTGAFERSFTMPEGVDSENVDAKLADGVLRVVLPKVQPEKPRAIEIKTQ